MPDESESVLGPQGRWNRDEFYLAEGVLAVGFLAVLLFALVLGRGEAISVELVAGYVVLGQLAVVAYFVLTSE